MPPIPYHHLYSIHILVIISRRVVDAFLVLVFSFLLADCFPLPILPYNSSISSPGFRVGLSTAVSRTNGPGSANFLLLFSPYLLRILLV